MISELFSTRSLWALLLLQSTACISVGLVASLLWRRHAARAHQTLLLGMLTSVLTPAVYVAVRHFDLGLLVTEASVSDVVVPFENHFDPALFRDVAATELSTIQIAITRPAPNVAEMTATTPPADEPTAATVPRNAVWQICWIVATALLAGRLLIRFLLGWRIVRSAAATDCEHLGHAVKAAKTKVGIDRCVRLQSSRSVRSPIIWCWSRTPVLLVQKHAEDPAAGADWVGVFCHELAHWKRRDHVSGLFAELLTVALPWHPLLWWARKRLLRLSEAACDDWAVYGASTAVDYAESLLNLSPESQLAFLPTVVGKEKAMKTRISRIVTGKCGSPRIGTRWAMATGLLTLLMVAGVALAQRRDARAEAPEALQRRRSPERERDERRELAVIGRRNVLQRMLEQLVAQARETETVLARHGDEAGEEGQILRSELDALREHIEMVERQLQNLERGGRPEQKRAAQETKLQRAQAEAQRQEMELQLHNLEAEMETLGDGDAGQARRLQQAIEMARKELDLMERRRRSAEREMDLSERAEAERREALRGRRHAILSEIEEIERELKGRDERDQGDSDGSRELRDRLIELREESQALEIRTEGDLQRNRLIEAHELLLGQIQQAEHDLHNVQGTDADRARRLRDVLVHLQERRLSLEHELSQSEPGRRTDRRIRRAPAEDEAPPVVRIYRLEHAPVGQMVDIIQPLIGQLGSVIAVPDDRTNSLLVEGTAAGHERIAGILQALDVPGDAPRQTGSAENAGIETEVAELRSKVNGLHEQMQQMRQMLQQIVKQTQTPRPPVLYDIETPEKP